MHSGSCFPVLCVPLSYFQVGCMPMYGPNQLQRDVLVSECRAALQPSRCCSPEHHMCWLDACTVAWLGDCRLGLV